MKAFLTILAMSATVSAGTVVERIVVQVNGELITESDVHAREQSVLNELYRQKVPADELTKRLDATRKTLVPDMVDEKLLQQKATDLGITVGPDQVDSVLQSIMDANGIPDKQALEKALTSEGQKFDEFKQTIERRVLIEKVRQFEVASKIVVTDDEVERTYKEHADDYRLPARVRLREIVLLTDERPKDKVLPEIQEVARLLKNGSDFAELATFFSQSPSADQGGDLGLVDSTTLAPEIRDAALKLKPSEVSSPVETKHGYHLLKLEEKKAAAVRPLAEVHDEILNKLQADRTQVAVTDYVKDLRQHAYIKVFPTPPGAKAYDIPQDLAGN